MSADSPLLSCDTATKFDRSHRGTIVVCGSHGGVYPAYLAASAGLRAVVAIHDTTLGPALGGCRMYPYKTEAEADHVRLRPVPSEFQLYYDC